MVRFFVDLRPFFIRIFYVVIDRSSLYCSPYQTIIVNKLLYLESTLFLPPRGNSRQSGVCWQVKNKINKPILKQTYALVSICWLIHGWKNVEFRCSTVVFKTRSSVNYTDKKEKKIFLILKEIQMGSVAKSYMRKGFLIYEEMRKYCIR